jgi:Na+-transporting NADH:ubiquinone oxidoreductase subunit D
MAAPIKTLFYDGFWKNNPIFVQVLGICSTLAVTNLLANTLFMCFGLVFSTAMSSLTISLMRNHIPSRIRMIVQVLIIAAFVMMVDILIKATAPDIHRFIGPYVGLIITNCIIMGRAEAFAMQNRPFASFIDGIAMGTGYSMVLVVIAAIREPLGFGTLLGHKLPGLELWWHQWTIMVMAPGAFFMLGLLSWIARARLLPKGKE